MSRPLRELATRTRWSISSSLATVHSLRHVSTLLGIRNVWCSITDLYIDERDKEIARWKEQIAELTKQNAELTKSNLNFHKYLGGQDTEIARLKKENGSLEKKVGGLERKIGGLEKKNGQLEKDLKQIKVWHHDTLIANKQYVAEDARKTTKTLREPRPNC